MNKTNTVSIIITTKNEEDVLGRLLNSINNQSYPKIETIVIDNNSDDKTKRIALKYKAKVFNQGPERSSQRNYGIKRARGKFLMILDADMELENDVVEKCLEKIDDNPEVVALVIPEYSIAINFWEKVKAYERSFYNKDGDVYTDAARFFKKSIVEEMGGYDETITGPEDWDLPERIKKSGFIIKRVETRIFHYERINSLFSLMKKKYYYGLKLHRYLSRHKISIFNPKTVYFLRPTFYNQWEKLIINPLLSLGLIIMFSVELLAGAIGYLHGKIRDL